jgi:hypothetical protein
MINAKQQFKDYHAHLKVKKEEYLDLKHENELERLAIRQ